MRQIVPDMWPESRAVPRQDHERSILLVEDDPGTLKLMTLVLQERGFEISAATSGAQAVAVAHDRKPDLVTLDLLLPDISGYEVMRRLRARSRVPVIVVTARKGCTDAIRGLELGADDYLGKPFNLKELLLRAGNLLRRTPPVAAGDDVLQFGGNAIDFRAQTARDWRGEQHRLSATELRMMRMLHGRAGEVVPRSELVRDLFGPATPPTARTLDNLAAKLRRLFERDSRQPRHLHTVRGVGLRLTVDPE